VIKVEREVSYAITALSPNQADAAAVLTALRGHWGIENRAHWVRDVSFDEDRCQVRSGAAPQVLAAGRNLAIALLRRAGQFNIAHGLRTMASRPPQAVQLILTAGHL
jgi:predicted transposase YbfD/YdcC